MDETVESRVRQVVSDHLGVGPEELGPSVSLVDELAADSLDLVELCLGLEAEFGIAVPETQLDQVRTYGDLVDLTLRLASERRAQRWSPDQPPRVWTHIVPCDGVATLERTLSLTPYTATEIGDDALHAGPGSRLEVRVDANSTEVLLSWVQDQFAWLRGRGVQVSVDRVQRSRPRRPRPQAA
jgi:acyl carrier protein